ncbi:MAG: hypothetical protein Q9178_008057 [Gyalolechia marmorata]
MSPNPSTPPPGGHDQAPIDVDELDSDFEVLSYSPAKGIANAVSKPTKTIDLIVKLFLPSGALVTDIDIGRR